MSAVDEIVAQSVGGRTRLVVRGDLDLATRDLFIQELGKALEDGKRVEVDLRELEYIDSVGLSSLIEADRMAGAAGAEGVSIIVSADGAVRRMVELTLLHLTLDVRHG